MRADVVVSLGPRARVDRVAPAVAVQIEDGPGMMSVEDAIVGRQSIRGYLAKPVPQATVLRVLEIAGRAPSGSNIQPWKVTVLMGGARDSLATELHDLHAAGDEGRAEYSYYPQTWREPYLARRRQTGWGLYGLLGLAKGDVEATKRQHRQNFLFFGAPVGLIFTIDRDLERGSWLDFGMFLQSVMLAARGEGLETCPQAAFNQYHAAISARLAIPASEMIVCGMAMGYADPDAVINAFRTERVPLAEFVRVLDKLPGA
jgi:nitroreductase